MNKCRFGLIVLLLGLLVVSSVGASGGTPELKVQKALGVTGTSDVYKIPIGSTIIHLPDGSTTITGPDGKLVISAKSSEVGLIPTPNGMARADHVYDVPSGSFVDGVSPNTIEVYDAASKLIYTVIDQAGGAGLEAAQTTPAVYTHGWIEHARYGYGFYTHLYGQWAVPTAPVNSWMDDDVVYLFDGIQGDGASALAGRQVIFQPVIGYNEDGFWVPGNPLNGRVWVADPNGNYYRSAAIGVSVGDVIIGSISYSTSQGWVGSIRDQNTGKYAVYTTNLLGTTNQFVCTTLEGWNLETNSDLFGTTDFVNLQVWNQNGQTIYPSWWGVIDPAAQAIFTGLNVVIYDYSHVRLHTDR